MLTGRAAGLGVLPRLQARGIARRAYPVAVGVGLARWRAQRTWRRDEGARSSALRAMELLVGQTSRAGEVERLARDHLYETYRYQELVWRLPVVTSLPVDGVQRLRALAQAGAGVIVSVVHQGQFGAHPAALARHGLAMDVLVGPALFGEQPPTWKGALRRQLLVAFRAGPGVTVLSADGAYAAARSSLEAGGTVLLGCDLKGSTPVRFLGRTVYVPSGTARLSMETGAPIVPVSVVQDRFLERLQVQEALWPDDHRDHLELLQAVFDRHAPAVLAWPQGMERPLSHLQTHPPDHAAGHRGQRATGASTRLPYSAQPPS